MKNNKYDVCGFDKEDALNDLHKNDLDIYKMYDLVFEDIVQNYIECLNEDVEENKDAKSITEEEKKEIAYRLIHKDEPLWEYIHETIYWEINRILENRK